MRTSIPLSGMLHATGVSDSPARTALHRGRSNSLIPPIPRRFCQVANPAELEKQRGIRQLIRHTIAVATLGQVPGKDGPQPAIVAAWASCLREDWLGDLGAPLRESAESFQWAPKQAG